MFKKIKGFPQYVVSTDGNVYREHSAELRRLKPRKDRDGYLQVNLSKDGVLTTKKVHRLVAETFIPNTKKRDTVNHKDGNKNNNAVENLEWLTRRQNLKAGGIKRKPKSKRIRQLMAIIQGAVHLLQTGIATKAEVISYLKREL